MITKLIADLNTVNRAVETIAGNVGAVGAVRILKTKLYYGIQR